MGPKPVAATLYLDRRPLTLSQCELEDAMACKLSEAFLRGRTKCVSPLLISIPSTRSTLQQPVPPSNSKIPPHLKTCFSVEHDSPVSVRYRINPARHRHCVCEQPLLVTRYQFPVGKPVFSDAGVPFHTAQDPQFHVITHHATPTLCVRGQGALMNCQATPMKTPRASPQRGVGDELPSPAQLSIVLLKLGEEVSVYVSKAAVSGRKCGSGLCAVSIDS